MLISELKILTLGIGNEEIYPSEKIVISEAKIDPDKKNF